MGTGSGVKSKQPTQSSPNKPHTQWKTETQGAEQDGFLPDWLFSLAPFIALLLQGTASVTEEISFLKRYRLGASYHFSVVTPIRHGEFLVLALSRKSALEYRRYRLRIHHEQKYRVTCEAELKYRIQSTFRGFSQ
jgi:hypothetical protein